MDTALEKQFNIINEVPNNWIRLIGAGSGGYFLLSAKNNLKKTIDLLHEKNIEFTKVKVSEEGVSSFEI